MLLPVCVFPCMLQVTSALPTHPQTVLGYGSQTRAVGKAALAGHITRALSIAVFAPSAMHLQQANLTLPFKLLLPFQLCLYAVAVMWAQVGACVICVKNEGELPTHVEFAAVYVTVCCIHCFPLYIDGSSTTDAAIACMSKP